MNHFSVLIGYLSEEVQEARNKNYNPFIEHYLRKSSGINTNADIFISYLFIIDFNFLNVSHNLLITS